MNERPEEFFFARIRNRIKLSYFIASIIPLSILVYFSIKYIYPFVTAGGKTDALPSNIGIILFLAVVLSILGLYTTTKATNESITSLQDIYAKLNTILEVTRHFRDTLYVDILLERIVKSAVDLSGAETGSLLLYDDDGNLSFKVLIGKEGQKIKGRLVKRGEGITGWVAEKGEPLVVNNVKNDPRFNSTFDKESGFKTKSILCVPLIYEKEIIGVIEMLNKIEGGFTEYDKQVLFSLADQAAISIIQNRMHESRHSDFIHMTEILVGVQDSPLPEKRGHSRRVAQYAHLIGKYMGLSEAELKQLYYASLLHDIGLLRLEYGEHWDRNKYTLHSQYGYDMIKDISLWKDVAALILNHHERYDGTGYPSGVKGADIPLGSRIIAIVETFDALTSRHSYKPPRDYKSALQEIEANSGTQFDPKVVDAFKAAVKETELITD
ncbi:MAG: GAF domain-containing protein [Nitrospirae bacterium]|nr:GAF domain-containing protein [Nitrospirota bacterium]